MGFSIDSITTDPDSGLANLRSILTGLATPWVESAWSANAGGTQARVVVTVGGAGTITFDVPKPNGAGITLSASTSAELTTQINEHQYLKWWMIATDNTGTVDVVARFGGAVYNGTAGYLHVSGRTGSITVPAAPGDTFAGGVDGTASNEFLYIKTPAAASVETYMLFMCNTTNLGDILGWNNDLKASVDNMLLWGLPILEYDPAHNGFTSGVGPILDEVQANNRITDLTGSQSEFTGGLGINNFVTNDSFPRSPTYKYNIGLTKSQIIYGESDATEAFYSSKIVVITTDDRVIINTFLDEMQHEWLYVGAYTPHAGAVYDDYPVIACCSRRYTDDYMSMIGSFFEIPSSGSFDLQARLSLLYLYKRGPALQIASTVMGPMMATHEAIPITLLSESVDREYLIPGWNTYIPLIGGSQDLSMTGGSTTGTSTFLFDMTVLTHSESIGLIGVARCSEEAPTRSEVTDASGNTYWVAYLSALFTVEGMRRKVAFLYD